MNIDQKLLPRAAKWMISRGWKTKLAKRGAYEQSLFEHSLIELDVLLALLPILRKPRHYGLSEIEETVLFVAILIHDAGKETLDWQKYVQGIAPNGWVSHIIPELTQSLVPEICVDLELADIKESVQHVISCCAEFHHSRPGRADGLIMEAVLSRGTDRFSSLAYLVKAIDHFCSASGPADAKDAIHSAPALSQHLLIASHNVKIRGVSTTFLHRAAQNAFQQQGWMPLLHFPDATIYACDPNDNPTIPTTIEISNLLQKEIDSVMGQDLAPLMVGSPTGDILPKPDLLSFRETRRYMESAAAKINSQSFIKKKFTDKRKVVERYWNLKERAGTPNDIQVEEDAGRISIAQPEMLVFKFFKGLMNPKKVKGLGENQIKQAQASYEAIFGTGSWSALESTSTLMAANDMARTVDYFWSLPASNFGFPDVVSIAALPNNIRLELLINLLGGICDEIFSACTSPRDVLSQTIATTFMSDLLMTTPGADIQAAAAMQAVHYIESKIFAGKESTRGIYLCPICNSPFNSKEGRKASADFIASPQTHTNRGIAYGSFENIIVCSSCYYERVLLQMLFGSRPIEIITLLPRLNFGPVYGEQFVQKVREWADQANLQPGYSLGFSDTASRYLDDHDPLALQPEELLVLFKGPFTPDADKTRRKEAMQRLKEEFGENLDMLNVACAQSPPFAKWEAAADVLISKGIEQQECRAIRKEILLKFPISKPISQTPNLIFVPLAYEIAAGNDESETSKGLRRLFVTLILTSVFDASVAIHKETDPVDFLRGVGSAFVPSVPAIRAIIGTSWITSSDTKRWIMAIGAASLLMRYTGLPIRSALYQILAAEPSEKIARRIEQEGKGLTLRHLRLIKQLPNFRGTEEAEAHA